MADKKITALTDLGSGIQGEDLLHVIDDPNSTPVNKKISVANVFNNIPTWLGLDGTAQTLAATGTVTVTESVTHLTLAATAQALNMLDGSNGQIKIITCIDGSGGGTMTLTPVNMAGASTVAWATGTTGASGGAGTGSIWVGLFTSGKWHTLSALGVTIG